MSLLLTGLLLGCLALIVVCGMVVAALEVRDERRREHARQQLLLDTLNGKPARVCDCTDGWRNQPLLGCPKCGGTGWCA